MMKKICFLITTRGNYGKTKTIIENLKGKAEIQYIVGGGCPDMEFFGKVRRCTIIKEGTLDGCYKSAGLLSIEAGCILEELRPDILVIVGDRFECLPFATIAFYMGIQIAHIEGGELSGNIDEGIRHAITKMASVHFPCSEEAMNRIIQLGEHPDNVFNVGATSFDVLREHAVSKTTDPYLILIVHPSSYIDVNIIGSAVYSFNIDVVWIDPNIDINSKEIKKHSEQSFTLEKLAPILKNAKCIVGNSSAGIREAAFIGTPSVNIGNRQNNRYKPPNVVSVECKKEDIIKAIQSQIEHGAYEPDYTYGDGYSGRRVAETLIHYSFKTQKVFYEDIGNNTGKGRE